MIYRTTSAPLGSAILYRAASAAFDASEFVRVFMLEHKTRRALRKLDTIQLQDIGVERDEINRIARQMARA
jgi:uncharacterized protein YjiS (DUF1127 family)